MSELGKIAHDAFYESFGTPYLEYDALDEGLQRGWDASGVAVAAHIANPTAEDYDRAAEELATRYALVEQMGHRATVAGIRETTFCGKQMIEATDIKGGGTSLISPESIYEITWITEADALARTRPWTATAITAGADSNPWGDYGDEDDQPATTEADL